LKSEFADEVDTGAKAKLEKAMLKAEKNMQEVQERMTVNDQRQQDMWEGFHRK